MPNSPDCHYNHDYDFASHVILGAYNVDEIRPNYEQEIKKKKTLYVTAEHDARCAMGGCNICHGDDCVATNKLFRDGFTDITYVDYNNEYVCLACARVTKLDILTTVQSTGADMFGAVYTYNPETCESSSRMFNWAESENMLFNGPSPDGSKFVILQRLYGYECANGRQRHTAWKAVVNNNPARFFIQKLSRRLLWDTGEQKELAVIFDKALDNGVEAGVLTSMQQHRGILRHNIVKDEVQSFLKQVRVYGKDSIELASTMFFARQKNKKGGNKK